MEVGVDDGPRVPRTTPEKTRGQLGAGEGQEAERRSIAPDICAGVGLTLGTSRPRTGPPVTGTVASVLTGTRPGSGTEREGQRSHPLPSGTLLYPLEG